MTTVSIRELFDKMLAEMGPQHWWPADSKVEIIIGAILTQNTNWNNVIQSLENLKKETDFNPERLLALDSLRLQDLIRPSGFYRNKTKGLREFFEWYREFDYCPDLVNEHFPIQTDLREHLMGLHSIGPETADVLILYVFDRITFIADTYARRLFSTLSGEVFNSYQSLASRINLNQAFNLSEAQEFHGLIDEFGKLYLRPNQDLSDSFLNDVCLEIPVN